MGGGVGKRRFGARYNLVVEYMLIINKALSSIPSTQKRGETERRLDGNEGRVTG